ncbi:PQ-loop repeat-containing protein [Candidatus Kaiserbacteria bacterium]|nr:PQ-loop repeat-containing protein [Candidatus Kaiserbacteria bacterium]
MELSAILGWTATALFTFCYIPQIYKTAKTQTVDGLSFWLLFISFIANIVALWYAFLINQAPLQVKYVGGLIFLGICLYLYWRVARSSKRAVLPGDVNRETSTIIAGDN